MTQAKISELKDRAGYYLKKVRQGEVVEVLDRDLPVARIVPVGPSPEDEDGWMRRSGLVKSGSMAGVEEILKRRPDVKRSRGVLKALLSERRTRGTQSA